MFHIDDYTVYVAENGIHIAINNTSSVAINNSQYSSVAVLYCLLPC